MKEITPDMLEFLKDCQARESNKLEPCTSGTRSATALLEQGLLRTAWYVGSNGKIQGLILSQVPERNCSKGTDNWFNRPV